MKYKEILLLILSSILIISSIIPSPSIEIVRSWQLDKEKRNLFKKLKVKTEIQIIIKSSEIDSMKNAAYTHKNYFDTNGNKSRREFYTDSVMHKLYYEEDYVTDEEGNVLEAYRKGKLIGTQEFDDEGRIIELNNYDEKGEACWTWEYDYDEVGNKVFETQYLYNELIDTLEYFKFEYENKADKILIKSKECLLDTSDIFYEEKEIFNYDSLGRETQYQTFIRDSIAYQLQTTNYEELSRIRIYYFPDGSIKLIDSMKINPEGRTIESKLYKNGYVIRATKFEYNSMGQILSKSRISDKGSLVFRYHYNDSGKEIYFGSFANDSLNFLRITNYLDNGLIINFEEKDFRNKTARVEHYEYEFY